MLQLRTWDSLESGNRDWLKARHHFAVDSQGNPAHARLGSLVVWNDDEIARHAGFPMHAHRDTEIVTYVREGVLHHEDSSGGRGEIRAGNVQALSAGRGIRHSEYNEGNAPLRLFQIWLLPVGAESILVGQPNPSSMRSARDASCRSRVGFPKIKLPCTSMQTPGYSGRHSRPDSASNMRYRRRATAISCLPEDDYW